MPKEEEYFISPLSKFIYSFPDPRGAPNDGLLSFGGDLEPNRILLAYRSGIFPWYNDDDPILWWSPNPRLLLYPSKFKTRKSFARVLRSGKFTVTFDKDFTSVITYCSTVPREGQGGTWLNADMKKAYIKLHNMGYAHSVEVWKSGELLGGLYGISMGKTFFGESMFSLASDASKVAFRALSDVLGARGYDFIDCQMKTDHLVSLGAVEVDRDRYLDELEQTLLKPSEIGSWQDFKWEYKE